MIFTWAQMRLHFILEYQMPRWGKNSWDRISKVILKQLPWTNDEAPFLGLSGSSVHKPQPTSWRESVLTTQAGRMCRSLQVTGKINSSGLLLLSLCAENILKITNTLFKQTEKLQIHLESSSVKKLSPLLDKVVWQRHIARKFKTASAMGRTECRTDHHFIRAGVKRTTHWKFDSTMISFQQDGERGSSVDTCSKEESALNLVDQNGEDIIEFLDEKQKEFIVCQSDISFKYLQWREQDLRTPHAWVVVE